MSLTLAKLQQLKRQAGGDIAPREPAQLKVAPPPTPPRDAGRGALAIEQLRQLLRVRDPMPIAPAPSIDRTLPGIEIAPGLHLREALVPDDALPDTFCGAFDRKDALDPARMLF